MENYQFWRDSYFDEDICHWIMLKLIYEEKFRRKDLGLFKYNLILIFGTVDATPTSPHNTFLTFDTPSPYL